MVCVGQKPLCPVHYSHLITTTTTTAISGPKAEMQISIPYWEVDARALQSKLEVCDAQNKKMKEFLLKGSRTKIKTGDTEEEIVIFSAQDMDTLTL